MSYVIQFFIFTFFLAVPHFPIQSYNNVIILTSVIIYISRFVFQFTDLYKSLLEKILDIQDETRIRIELFDEIVEKHFPLSNEIFYLFVKVMFSFLFFAIIFDTMKTVGYIKSGTQPDLTTVISLIFLFGPPRLVEALLMTDFTSRVHMKEYNIRKDLEKTLESNIKANEPTKTICFTEDEMKLCCIKWLINLWRKVRPANSNVPLKLSEYRLSTCCKYNPKLFWLRWLCMFCCGCFSCLFDGKGYCENCLILDTGYRSPANSTNKDEESKIDNVEITTLKKPCVCIELSEIKNDDGKDTIKKAGS